MQSAAGWPLVIVESPVTGDMEANRKYAIRACIDCLRRKEVPFASQLFFPQFFNELTPEERELGVTAGYVFWPLAKRLVFYIDHGMSAEMKCTRERAFEHAKASEHRTLDQYRKPLIFQSKGNE